MLEPLERAPGHQLTVLRGLEPEHLALDEREHAAAQVRAARLDTQVGDLKRTLVVVESEELLLGQKRGIAVALRKGGQIHC